MLQSQQGHPLGCGNALDLVTKLALMLWLQWRWNKIFWKTFQGKSNIDKDVSVSFSASVSISAGRLSANWSSALAIPCACLMLQATELIKSALFIIICSFLLFLALEIRSYKFKINKPDLACLAWICSSWFLELEIGERSRTLHHLLSFSEVHLVIHKWLFNPHLLSIFCSRRIWAY